MNISQELKGLIPPLSESEKAQLEANCKADGIRDALIIARYPNEDGEAVEVLADGHNRYEIAQDNNLPYKTEVKEFDSLSDVRLWMRKLQLGRRNLTDGWKWELAQGIREELLEKGKEKYQESRVFSGNQHTASMSLNDTEPKHSTRTEVAETLNWSKGKTAQAEQVWKKAPEEVKQAVRDGEMTIGGAYKEVKKIEITERRQQIRETFEEQEIAPGDKKYRIIYADPPWKYGNSMPEYVTEPQDYYLLMDTEDICNMPIKDITEENAVLFMWTTSPHLPEALDVVKAWGFKYKTTFIWDKIKHNMGHYNSVRHEILLVCTRGACTPDVKKLFDSVVSIERTEHSRKPVFFREIIETIYTNGNRIELFAREAPEGWDVFGNQSSSNV